VACPTQVPPEMPRQAIREGVTGTVRAQITVKGGQVTDVQITSGPRVFYASVRAAIMQYKCIGDATTSQEIVFKLD